ncbi:MAG: type II secretion system F family protein [Candidatus Beckwithbacteria bacterium]|nr:type II secretion system F family protein [Candidatus Beckwithbacteria bacterium]
MEKFNYLATDKDNRKVKGTVEAVNLVQAQSILRSKNLFIINLDKIELLPAWMKMLESFNKVRRTEVVHFTRQLATMVTAGLPLTNALAILKYQSGAAMGKLTDEILRDVEGGGSFYKALQKHEGVFDRIYLSLVRSGEAAGVLEKVLQRLADNLEKEGEFRAKTKSALIYPAIITIAMVVVATIMMIFVIPKLTSMYNDFGAELPMVTKVLIGISTFVAKTIWLWLVLLVVGGYSFSKWRKTASGRLIYDTYILRLPIIGPLKTKMILTEITRTLALLVESGVAIVEALEIVSGAAGNELFGRSIKTAAKDVEKGVPLAAAIGQFEHFPPLISQMLAVGEETGKIDEVMFNVSRYFETESEQAVKGLTTAIEPLMMIILGVGVGFLVIAIIMPIYNLTSQF